jgi:hypothetical protein
MRYLSLKIRKIVTTVLAFELQRNFLKFIFFNSYLPFVYRQKSFFLLDKLLLNSCFTRIKHRCFLLHNARAMFKFFRLSRHAIKKLMVTRALTGTKSLSW